MSSPLPVKGLPVAKGNTASKLLACSPMATHPSVIHQVGVRLCQLNKVVLWVPTFHGHVTGSDPKNHSPEVEL
jgi:hypothetical protein